MGLMDLPGSRAAADGFALTVTSTVGFFQGHAGVRRDKGGPPPGIVDQGGTVAEVAQKLLGDVGGRPGLHPVQLQQLFLGALDRAGDQRALIGGRRRAPHPPRAV
ncbi:hypothetical protein ACH40F_51355 [Streptomyces sp. NPDC020794]|uniref:hypothetical protein n=1 Tax=unclassified Streptomyces TaxID=2593676 RepID=UPI0036E05FD6